MPKLICAQLFNDGLSDDACLVLRLAIEHALSERYRTFHQLTRQDFCRRALLRGRMTRRKLAEIIEEANAAKLVFSGIDTDHLEADVHDLGTYPPFQFAGVSDTHVEFEVCPALFFRRVYFEGFWNGADERLRSTHAICVEQSRSTGVMSHVATCS